ncbi:MAG: zinc-dependent metalloprotease [Chitinophagales bacterium]|nr:zinc-dependent metalloprotease [Chitinophagales bacterium]MDW8274344.1 zinc-dependent metalloprotease [Chitinophagales bacterium]
MKKNLSATFLLLAFFAIALSQQTWQCAAVHAEQMRETESPGYLDAVKKAFLTAKKNITDNPSRGATPDSIYRIRTVFHIVYTNSIENLPDSVIYSQVQVLNEDFRRRNPDAAKTRSIFSPFAADAGIEFVLADVDPDGNPTNGITRTKGNPPPSLFGGFNINDDVKQKSKGGVDPWPTDKYLNIWVCNLLGGFGVLGYAYPPAAPLPNWGNQNPNADSARQGVVLYYRAVGRNNPHAINDATDGGRSATHEIGHYLGLRHIWGDDQPLFGAGNKCANDQGGGSDGIDDTPDAKDATQQICDTLQNSCPDPDMDMDYPDMTENYMDYSSDDCQNLFTHGQVALMREVLRLYRPGIFESVPNSISSTTTFRQEFKINVYPNPASQFLHVSFDDINLPVKATLLSSDGKKVFTEITDKSMLSIPLQTFSSGVYFLSVQCGGEQILRKVCVMSAGY